MKDQPSNQKGPLAGWTLRPSRTPPVCPWPHTSFAYTGSRAKSQPIRAWGTACQRAGPGTALVHHLSRRAAVRKVVRSGMQKKVALMILGRKTGQGIR